MEPIQKSVLPNGIRVVTETMSQVRTASLGLWVGTGSRYEAASQHGISHFLEHLFFKGTKTRSALAIAQAVDALGGQMNAFTDKEHTCFYVKVLANHLPAIVELMADMLLNSAFEPEAIEKERQVITEEIKTYEDSPDEVVQDLVAQTMWDGHPLGRSVIGTRKAVAKLSRDDFVRYIEKRYRADNIVISVAGDVAHAAVVDLVGRYFGTWDGKASVHPTETPAATAAVSIKMKDIEQVHLCLAAPGRSQAADDRYVLAVLDNVIGGGMSSRLFQEIRETRGLVYTIASYAASYREGGMFVVYGAMSPENAPEVLRLTIVEIARLAEGLEDAELERAKESLKGGIMLGLESTGSRMFKLGRSELYYGRQIDLDEILGRIDAVSVVDVQRMAAEIFAADRLAMAAIGPFAARSAARADLERTFTDSLPLLKPRALATPA
ncbi:MAG: pitrilysin family protein [Armatimonadota bacterium]|nr:pitrilysin family protein [Armatimonadota bacterium]